MGQRTALYRQHLAAGARMVDFAGWDMPLHYGSQLDEHRRVRESAGLFDVSHMTVIDVEGEQALDWLRYLLANDAARLHDGTALYTCLLNEQGGVLDDLIVYRRAPDRYRLVTNAATRDKDLDWLHGHMGDYQVELRERADLAMLALQGPKAPALLAEQLDAAARERLLALKPFEFLELDELFIARTGYTGEDGFELILPNEQAAARWQQLLEAGASPVGLGARDTLRLEAGLHLYGQDMDEQVTPLESGLGWTVAWAPEARNFIGRGALEHQREQEPSQKLVGLVLEARGVLRPHQTVLTEAGPGEITSGSFSPVLGCSIALARVPADAEGPLEVELRGRRLPVRLVKPPFVRKGRALIELSS